MRSKNFKYWVFGVLLVSGLTGITRMSVAQPDTTGSLTGVRLQLHGGDILIHTPKIDHFENDFSSSVEVTYLWQTTGDKRWQQAYDHPVIGLSAMVTRFGNPDILGNAYSIFPHLTYTIIDKPGFTFAFRGGTGLGYLDQPYHALENTKNNAIGSHINNVIFMDFRGEWTLNPQWYLNTSLTFTHFSNAAFASPNLGINVPAFSVGLEHYFDPIEPTNFQRDSFPPYDKGLEFTWRVGLGIKEDPIPNGPKYPIYTTAFTVSRKIRYANKLSLSAFAAYNYVVYDYIVQHQTYTGEEFKTSLRLGIELGDEFVVNNFSLLGRIGVYIHNPLFQFDPFYTRLGVKYHFLNRRIFAGVYLKAHRFTADYAEWTIGVNF